MQMLRIAAFVALCSPPTAVAVLRIPKRATAQPVEAAKPHLVAQEALPDDAEPVVVIVVDGEAGEPPKDWNSTCQGEVFTHMMNETQMELSHQCEVKTGYTDAAFASLQRANLDEARQDAEKTFSECGGLSKSCAKELAPSAVMKMRFAGFGVDDKCHQVALELEANQTGNKTCEEASTKAMFQKLNDKDMEASMTVAQHGLHNCQGIQAPCDFQLAPVLLMQLVQVAEAAQFEQELHQVLLAGLRKAQNMSDQLVLKEKHGAVDKSKVSLKHASTNKTHKAISLLSIADNVRIDFKSSCNRRRER